MPKVTLPDQHAMLEQHWSNDCCLCSYEAEVAKLKEEIATLREGLAKVAPPYICSCGTYDCIAELAKGDLLVTVLYGSIIYLGLRGLFMGKRP